MHDILKKSIETTSFINSIIKNMPEIAIVLGSGLGSLANEITDRIEIPYEEIPNFPKSTVEGHENKLIAGKIYGRNVIAMQGRFHYYEGFELNEVTFPIKVFAMLGVSKLIVSNAAGGLNKTFKLGDLMLITDHINLCGLSPLRGENRSEFGERFPSMTNAYSQRLIDLAKNVANSKDLNKKINLREGVYAYMPGPQYETKAEIKMLSMLGADAVGMSTVPEVISAVHSGMEVLGISCITNLSNSVNGPTHEEVIDVAASVEEDFKTIVMRIIREM